MSTNVMLVFVLMAIAIISLAALSLDYSHKISLLREDVKRLESSQVLLMVPDEQAKPIADWLASHPDQTKALLKLATPGEQKQITLGPESEPSNAVPPLLENNTKPENPTSIEQTPNAEQTLSPLAPKTSADVSANSHVTDTLGQTAEQPITISESADGVKVISLPNGGIRITTREAD
ncbi:membrane anchored protein in chemotaxis locus [Shewanella acanthi]|uniref:membrane anchored protein in chemotaxis locus n=1 Tax=Shewanella acanthi TaxID=2864212 RepID=UPI001C65F148|nr:membrane anchored protein in chemotaxis locus [Shewanella acanthi]QYJ80554.1 membrane anchored protein in chemotaxis locus [Shewanella acanthi]